MICRDTKLVRQLTVAALERELRAASDEGHKAQGKSEPTPGAQ